MTVYSSNLKTDVNTLDITDAVAPEESADRIKLKEYLGYFGYGFGQCFAYGIIGTFILYFYTDILMISAVSASIIFLIARVWDAVNDPLVAGIMDSRVTKEGKFRGYLKFVPLLVFISTVICFFNPDISLTGKVLYAAVTYILWGTFYTFSDIPFWSMSAVMSARNDERTKLVSAANVGVCGGIGMASISVPPLVAAFSNGDEGRGYLIAVAILMTVGYLLMMYGYSVVRERVKPISDEKPTMKDVVATLKTNRPMFKVLAVFMFKFCTDVVQAIVVYFFIYNMRDSSLMTFFGIVVLASAVAIMILPFVTRYFKKKHIYIAIMTVDIALRVWLYLTGYENVYFVMGILTATQFINAMTIPLVSMMLVETIDYSEVRTGKRCEAITFSGQTFTGKLSVALAGAATGLTLSLIGYVPSQEQTEFTLNGIFFAVALLPALGSLCRILILLSYRYTETEHREDQRKLAEMRAAAASRA